MAVGRGQGLPRGVRKVSGPGVTRPPKRTNIKNATDVCSGDDDKLHDVWSLRLNTLDPNALQQVKERIENEIQQFARSVQPLQIAAQKFEESREAIESFNSMKQGQILQLPLTSSLYASGTIADTEKFLIDIGTGYFVEMSAADGQAYCKRKMAKLTESLHNLQGLIKDKQIHLSAVGRVLQSKLAQSQ